MKFCLRMRCQSSRFYHEIHWNSTFLLAPKMKLLFSSFFPLLLNSSLCLSYMCLSPLAFLITLQSAALFQLQSIISIHTPQIHTARNSVCVIRLFFLLCSSLLCFSFIRIHTCSPLTHMMRTITCTHTKQRTRKIPRNNRFV